MGICKHFTSLLSLCVLFSAFKIYVLHLLTYFTLYSYAFFFKILVLLSCFQVVALFYMLLLITMFLFLRREGLLPSLMNYTIIIVAYIAQLRLQQRIYFKEQQKEHFLIWKGKCVILFHTPRSSGLLRWSLLCVFLYHQIEWPFCCSEN